MQMHVEVRYPVILRARMPRELIDAVEAAARAKFMTVPRICGRRYLEA